MNNRVHSDYELSRLSDEMYACLKQFSVALDLVSVKLKGHYCLKGFEKLRKEFEYHRKGLLYHQENFLDVGTCFKSVLRNDGYREDRLREDRLQEESHLVSKEYPQVNAKNPRSARKLYFQTARTQVRKRYEKTKNNFRDREKILQQEWSRKPSDNDIKKLDYVSETKQYFKEWAKYERKFGPCSKEEFEDLAYIIIR